MPESGKNVVSSSLLEMNDWRKKSGLTCTFVIFMALNIAMVVIGAKAVHKCPKDTLVPTYLVVAGTTSISLLLVRLIISHILVPTLEQTSLLNEDEDDFSDEEDQPSGSHKKKPKKGRKRLVIDIVLALLRVYDSLASLFSTCWLVVGGVAVYGSHSKGINFTDVNSQDYCDHTAFVFAFVVVTIGFVSLCLSVLGAVLACCCKKQQE